MMRAFAMTWALAAWSVRESYCWAKHATNTAFAWLIGLLLIAGLGAWAMAAWVVLIRAIAA